MQEEGRDARTIGRRLYIHTAFVHPRLMGGLVEGIDLEVHGDEGSRVREIRAENSRVSRVPSGALLFRDCC